MGLDDFASESTTDGDDEQSSSTSQSSTGSQTSGGGVSETITDPIEEGEMNFYGTGDKKPGTRPMERKGAMSNHSVADLAQTTDKEIVISEDDLKFHLPIFTMLTKDSEFEDGERYQLKHDKEAPRASWNDKVVACIAVVETRLGSINKELAMFEAGSTSKKRVMDTLDAELGHDVTADTIVYLNFFGDVFHLRDLAQANEEYREGELIERGKIVGKVVKPKELRVALDQEANNE